MIKHLARAAIATGLAAACQFAYAVPVTWAGNSHEYDVITAEGVTWTDANAATALLGGGWHLATITSAAENNFLTSILPAGQADRSHYWLGGTDARVEETWEWVTGETWSYENWSGGEPNNVGNEDYLAFDLRGSVYAWNDAPDDLGAIYGFARGYVIERAAQVPEPGLLSLLGLALVALGVTRRKAAVA